MKIAFSGARYLDDQQHRILMTSLGTLDGIQGDEFTSGACVGVDCFIGRWCAERFSKVIHRVVVPANRTRVGDYSWATEVLEMPDGTTYRDRNYKMLEFADVLLAFPAYAEENLKSKRSGTWQTIREARRRNIVTVVNPLNV